MRSQELQSSAMQNTLFYQFNLLINQGENFMSIICVFCGDDIDAKYQDNMSNVCGQLECEEGNVETGLLFFALTKNVI